MQADMNSAERDEYFSVLESYRPLYPHLCDTTRRCLELLRDGEALRLPYGETEFLNHLRGANERSPPALGIPRPTFLVVDVLESGVLRAQLEPLDAPDCRLRNFRGNEKMRAIAVDLSGDTVTDLDCFERLHEAYDIGITLLWHMLDASERGMYDQVSHSDGLQHSYHPQRMHNVLPCPDYFEFGTIKLTFLAGWEICDASQPPVAIAFCHEVRDRQRKGAAHLCTQNRLLASDVLHQKLEVGRNFIHHLKEASPREQDAEKLAEYSRDSRYALLMTNLAFAAQGDCSVPFTPCLRTVIQYQVVVQKMALSAELARGEQYHTDHAKPSAELRESESCKALSRFSEQLQRQKILNAQFVDSVGDPTKRELVTHIVEFERLAEEARLVLEHKTQRLSYRLNTTLLQESRASIALAQQSIKESQRTRNLTILAFIFVPLSLATSIFGMNVQEINQTGEHIRIFVIVAIVMFCVTILMWGIVTVLIRACDNWCHRSSLLESHVKYFRHRRKMGKARKWKSPWRSWDPREHFALLRRGLVLGVWTYGRYDPKGCLYALRMERIRDVSHVPPAFNRAKLKNELSYLFGFKRIPAEEDFFSLWRLRGEPKEKSCWELDFVPIRREDEDP